jgi:O-antigen/teichoic acid export membrane protein
MRAMTKIAYAAQRVERIPSKLEVFRSSAAKQSTMLFNAFALSAGAGATAVLGFVYWWFAAHNFPAQAVGFAAAAISLMNFLAQLGELGMGTMLMGEVPKMPDTASSLISATLLSVLASMLLIGGVYLVISNWTSLELGAITGSDAGKALFVIGLALTGFTLVLDQAFVGMLRSSLQMYRTVSFAAIKLLLIIGIVLSVGTASEFGVFGTWIGGQLCSIACLCALCIYGRKRIWCVPRVGLLRPLLGTVLRHHLLSVVIQAPGLILPFIVAVVLSPQTNAAFYAAWTLVNVVLLVPASLTSAMYSVSARDPALLSHRLKISLAISVVVGSVTGTVLLFWSETILGLFSPIYPLIAGPSLQLLGFGALGVMLKYHYVVVQRLRYRMVEASIFLGAGGALEILAAIAGAQRGGLLGLTEGWLLAVCVEAAVLSPVVWCAMRQSHASETVLDSRSAPVGVIQPAGAADAQSGVISCDRT